MTKRRILGRVRIESPTLRGLAAIVGHLRSVDFWRPGVRPKGHAVRFRDLPSSRTYWERPWVGSSVHDVSTMGQVDY